MAEWVFSNQAFSTLAAAISSTDTSFLVAAGDGNKFPTLAAGQTAKLVLEDRRTGAFEILDVSSRSGDMFTVTRGAEATLARAWPAGTHISNRVTAEVLNTLHPQIAQLSSDMSQVLTWKGQVSQTINTNAQSVSSLNSQVAQMAAGLNSTTAIVTVLQGVVPSPAASDAGKVLVASGADAGGWKDGVVEDVASDLAAMAPPYKVGEVDASTTNAWPGSAAGDPFLFLARRGSQGGAFVGVGRAMLQEPRLFVQGRNAGTPGPWHSTLMSYDYATAQEALDINVSDKVVSPATAAIIADAHSGWRRISEVVVSPGQGFVATPVFQDGYEYMIELHRMASDSNSQAKLQFGFDDNVQREYILSWPALTEVDGRLEIFWPMRSSLRFSCVGTLVAGRSGLDAILDGSSAGTAKKDISLIIQRTTLRKLTVVSYVQPPLTVGVFRTYRRPVRTS